MEEKVLDILRMVLEIPQVDKTCSQATCEQWDSIHHLDLMVELEMAYSISLDPEEMARMKSYAAIIDVLKSKGCQ